MAPTSPTTEKVEKKGDEEETKDVKATEELKPEPTPASAPADAPAPAPAPASPATPAAADEKEAAGGIPTIDPKDVPRAPDSIIDMEVLEQIREMDDMDDEDEEEQAEGPRAFSKGIVYGYFDQAEHTFEQMQTALTQKDLENLSSLGHFLKGSSAAVGVIRVQAICERIQHYGHRRDEEENTDLSEAEALDKIAKVLAQCRKDYALAKAWLNRLYDEEE